MLLDWKKWRASSRQYVASQAPDLSLRPIIEFQFAEMCRLHTWLLGQLAAANDLTEVNELIARRNAALAGVSVDEARRLSGSANDDAGC